MLTPKEIEQFTSDSNYLRLLRLDNLPKFLSETKLNMAQVSHLAKILEFILGSVELASETLPDRAVSFLVNLQRAISPGVSKENLRSKLDLVEGNEDLKIRIVYIFSLLTDIDFSQKVYSKLGDFNPAINADIVTVTQQLSHLTVKKMELSLEPDLASKLDMYAEQEKSRETNSNWREGTPAKPPVLTEAALGELSDKLLQDMSRFDTSEAMKKADQLKAEARRFAESTGQTRGFDAMEKTVAAIGSSMLSDMHSALISHTTSRQTTRQSEGDAAMHAYITLSNAASSQGVLLSSMLPSLISLTTETQNRIVYLILEDRIRCSVFSSIAEKSFALEQLQALSETEVREKLVSYLGSESTTEIIDKFIPVRTTITRILQEMIAKQQIIEGYLDTHEGEVEEYAKRLTIAEGQRLEIMTAAQIEGLKNQTTVMLNLQGTQGDVNEDTLLQTFVTDAINNGIPIDANELMQLMGDDGNLDTIFLMITCKKMGITAKYNTDEFFLQLVQLSIKSQPLPEQLTELRDPGYPWTGEMSAFPAPYSFLLKAPASADSPQAGEDESSAVRRTL